MKRLVIIASLLMLPACSANEWEMSYRTLSERRHEPLPADAAVELVDCSTFADELYIEKVKAAEAHSESLGYSNFDFDRTRGYGSRIKAEYVPDLEEFARSIGADLVIYRIHFVGTERARQLETYDTPRTDTTYHTTVVTGPDGSRSRYTTTVTSTGWETRLITRTVSIDRYAASAAYFRRERR